MPRPMVDIFGLTARENIGVHLIDDKFSEFRKQVYSTLPFYVVRVK